MPAFIHLMPMDSLIFNGELIRLINNEIDGCNHLFILSDRASFDQLSTQYTNVRYEPRIRLKTIHQYDQGDSIFFLHSLFLHKTDLCVLKTSLARRMVWCVWGHDLYRAERRSPINRLKVFLANRKIAQFKAIAAGFSYDEIEIHHRFGHALPVYNALYPSGYFQNDIDQIVATHQRTDQRTNILVGHSGYSFLQHKKQLDRLAHYKDKNIVITLVLCYGDKAYIEEVIDYAKTLFEPTQLHIVRQFTSWQTYIDMLCDVDVAIFDFDHQAAFGTLILLSYLQKKLYLSPTGIMYHALHNEQTEVYDCTEIGQIAFGQFTARNSSNTDRSYIISLLDKSNIIAQWKYLFQQIR